MAAAAYTLVVCEKPDAARRIAQALGISKETRMAGVPFFEVTPRSGQRRYVVCSALGHLYGLADLTGNRSVYPVFDLEWVPVTTKNFRAARAIKIISELSRNASGFVHACDYDQEGEVIGYNILQYACGNKYEKALRAKFSTLTDAEIRESFGSLAKPNNKLVQAGRSRHTLDFLYGVNLSRALAKSFKATAGRWRNLSIGRVQGPTLAFAADRELEIRLHIPDPYWTVTAKFVGRNGQVVTAHYEKPKVMELAEAQLIVTMCRGKDGTVTDINSRKVVLRPPTPFNISDLQQEAYRLFKLSPSYTLAIAEKLYLKALISYPRTSSQKLPPSIGYRRIISDLSRVGGQYGSLATILLSKESIAPNEGKMTDPAHPAIYPTGVVPQQQKQQKLGELEFKLYDLIVKRFFATFGDPTVSQHTEVSIDVQGYVFKAEGRTTVYDGWIVFYKPYFRLEQHDLAELHPNDILKSLQVEMEEKFTQPPRRYNQASLLAKMEEERIGTKATRAEIIATLFNRSYIVAGRGGGIEVTDLGFAVIESMKRFVPAIVSTSLTRLMEEQLEKVERGFADSASVIDYAVDALVHSLAIFIEKEHDIGRQISDAAAVIDKDNGNNGSKNSNNKAAAAGTIGSCPICKTGQLRMVQIRATKKRFVGCSNYSKGCKAAAPLPQKGTIKGTGEKCVECDWPIVGVTFARRAKPWKICINMRCPVKKKSD